MPQNPVISKFGQASGTTGAVGTPDLQALYDAPSYRGPRTVTRYMTLDDVVQRTGAMLAVLLATGVVGWSLPTKDAGAVAVVGLLGGLGLALYMSVTMKAGALTALSYAAFEGLVLGAVSRVFNDRWPGIVVQAVTGTICVAGGMLVVYKTGAIRVTPRFTRVVIGGLIGVIGLSLINALAYLVHPGGLGLRSGGGIAILFSLLCIGLAAASLAVDFDMIEKGIRSGVDQKFAWYASFGLMVTLVWLYLEILRLLSFFRD